MTTNDDVKDNLREMEDVLRLLGDEYAMTRLQCAPGGHAVKITKESSEDTLVIVIYSDPDEILFFLFGGDGYCISHLDIFDRTFDDISGKCINIIREFL